MKKTKSVWIIIIVFCVGALILGIYSQHKEIHRSFPQEMVQPETISPETIFTNNNVIDLGNHIIAYYTPNDENFSSSYGYYANDFIGDNYIAIHDIEQNERLRSGEAVFPQTVWTETFSFGEQMYEVTFERISTIYDLGLITGGLYADYCLTVKAEKGDVIETVTIINYPIVYEEVHWLIDLSEDGFSDIAIAFSDDWGMDALSGQTSLLTLIWNQETHTYEKTTFPWSYQDQDCANYHWSHPLWNEELSSLISFVGNDNYGCLIMDMYSFLDGRWQRVRRLKAYYDENEYSDSDNPVCLGYYELIYSADGSVVEETAIDCESEAVWFDKDSYWSRYNENNFELFPGDGWDLVSSDIGGVNIEKFVRE